MTMKTYVLALGVLALTACGSQNSMTASGVGASSETLASAGGSARPDFPVLHKIETYTFEKPYGCDGDYKSSALFLSTHSLERNAPDLLYNGACGSNSYIQATTAGDDFAMISDLGDVSLESVTASKAINYQRVVGHDNTFKESADLVPGHTYVVLISKSDKRALYILRVEKLAKDGPMTIRYAVKSYSIQSSTKDAPGFDWERENQ